MHLSHFNFNLPRELIADQPAEPRDSSRLLKVADSLENLKMSDFDSLLNPGDVLVFNDTKVIPARIIGKRGEAKVEVTLHKNISDGIWCAFAKPARKLQPGETFTISDKFSAKVLEKKEGEVKLDFNVRGDEFYQMLNDHGQPPLPPYIERKKSQKSDVENYQTIYAKNKGAVAAPTAGLHFTDELLEKIRAKGVQTIFTTLHVGAGTFLPVKVDNIKDHKMHAEYGVLTAEAAEQINAAKRAGGRVICVGTTSLRLLESVADDSGNLKQFSDETDIFITPGYKFKIADCLLTNFHIPKSTLFMLVSAFAGLDKMKAAYAHAIENKYRFYSYGDACFLSVAGS